MFPTETSNRGCVCNSCARLQALRYPGEAASAPPRLAFAPCRRQPARKLPMLLKRHVLPLQDMQLPNTHIDANLHPTKEEVAILHQEVVIDSVCSAIEHVLRKQLPGNRCAAYLACT